MQEEKNITIEKVYFELKRIERALEKKGVLNKEEPKIPVTALLSEKSLAKEWLNPEEDEAWKDL